MAKSLNFRYLLILFFSFSLFQLSAQPNLDEGKALFKQNCRSCHNANMKDDMTGPALAGVEERWDDQETLYEWIRNSAAVIAAGDPYAVSLYNDWNKVAMNAFPNLTDPQIESILAYINGVADGSYPPKVAGDTTGPVVVEKTDNTLLFATLALILVVLAVVLARIIGNLNHMLQVQAGNPDAQRRTLTEMLTSKSVVSFVIFALVVFGGFVTVNNAIDLGRQQGYQPEQPIKFSHATHAGTHKIDCQYCHDGARRSKHSVIPAANTCMNCHKAIKKGSKYGTAELTKIFASIGYNPATDKYIDDYDSMSQEDIEKIFREWITTEYLKDNELTSLDPRSQKAVNKQWDGIVNSLTNEQKTKIQGPIEWTRIHNLPDHAYFNHAQHVSVGKVECQQCHGPVEEMEVLGQYAPLSMGWCVNCHRQTEVQFAGNEYYDSYEKYHEQMKSGDRSKVTVEEIGGLECQKCHY